MGILGASLSPGVTPKMFVMSNSELVWAICKRNTAENFFIPRYTSALLGEDPSLFQCSCDGGAHPKSIYPFGYHSL